MVQNQSTMHCNADVSNYSELRTMFKSLQKKIEFLHGKLKTINEPTETESNEEVEGMYAEVDTSLSEFDVQSDNGDGFTYTDE